MGNKIENITTLTFTNFNHQTENNDLILTPIDSKLDKTCIKKERKSMKTINKHNQDSIDFDILEKCILEHFFLMSVEKQARTEIIKQMSLYQYQENFEIFKKGDHPTYFYILAKGECEYIKNNKIIKLKRGDYFGDVSLIYGINREGLVKTNTECLIWTLEKKHFRKITEHILNITFEEINKNIEYIPVLSSLNYKIKNKIINHLYKGTFFANKPIFLRNDISHSIYFIKDGKIDVKLDDKILYTLKEGDYFGELSVMLKCNRIYDFIPQTKCVLFSVPVSFLYDLCGENYPLEICLTIIKSAFINVENFNKFNVKVLNDVFQFFQIDFYENSEILLKKNVNKKNEFIIIPIEGYLLNANNDEIICERGELLFGDFIYNDDNNFIENDIKCIPHSLIAKIETKILLNNLKCTFKESIEKSTSMQQLKKVKLFKNLTETKLENIFNKLKLEKFSNGKNVITQGDQGTRFYILKKGFVDVFVNEKYIRTMNQNEYLGERALFFKEARTATIRAKGDCELFYLEKEDFDDVIETNLKEYLKNRLYLQDDKIELSDLVFYKSLGKGSYGNVSLVKAEKNSYFYAIKNISNKQILYSKLAKNIELERGILLQIDHPFIVKLVKSLKDEKYIYYLMDYIKGKELYDVIRDIGILSKSQAQFYIASIILAVKYLHERYFVFRDIKPENIMVLSNGFIKIIDFGAAKKLKDKTNTIIGTPQYMAPEIILGDDYSFEVDYWSIGVCLYEFVYGEYPFANEVEEVIEIYSAVINQPLVFPTIIKDKDCKNLIQLMLNKNKTARYYKYEQISSHLWFKDFDWDALLSLDIKPEYVPQFANKKENYNTKSYIEYIKNLKDWECSDRKIKISEEDKNVFEAWLKAF